MLDEEEQYRKLFAELENYEQVGVPMTMDGFPASPQQIVTAHMIKEEGAFMRDYVINPRGNIEELTFYNINETNHV